jgi:hypothetical protein
MTTLGQLSSAEAARLETLVACHLDRDLDDLLLVVQPEGAVLHGHAASAKARQQAEDLVVDSTHLKVLANEIEVP